MKRKRSSDDDKAMINEIIKRVKLCLDKKRKRDGDDEDDQLLALSCKRMKLNDDTDNSLRQQRRDILVYL